MITAGKKACPRNLKYAKRTHFAATPYTPSKYTEIPSLQLYVKLYVNPHRYRSAGSCRAGGAV